MRHDVIIHTVLNICSKQTKIYTKIFIITKQFYWMCVHADTANSWMHPKVYDGLFVHVNLVWKRDGRDWCPIVNLLWHIEVIWCLRFWLTLVQVIACYLPASRYYMGQCWLLISEILWHLCLFQILWTFPFQNVQFLTSLSMLRYLLFLWG